MKNEITRRHEGLVIYGILFQITDKQCSGRFLKDFG